MSKERFILAHGFPGVSPMLAPLLFAVSGWLVSTYGFPGFSTWLAPLLLGLW